MLSTGAGQVESFEAEGVPQVGPREPLEGIGAVFVRSVAGRAGRPPRVRLETRPHRQRSRLGSGFRGASRRCPHCHRRCARYDAGVRRRWQALDVGVVRAVIEAQAPRVSCPEHRVVVAAVPWARRGAGHTRAFDQMVARLAVHTARLRCRS
ncbi:transposase family protein [Micromonospora sp. NPDC000663]|uniref:transposase family protein n=1 Tax=Micromonospora sp. NPDC000663 TaxID=3364218 RepID=UPI0036C61E82